MSLIYLKRMAALARQPLATASPRQPVAVSADKNCNSKPPLKEKEQVSMTKFWDVDVTEETNNLSGSIGVKIGNTRMLHSVYDTAKKIANAGSDGVLTGDVSRSNVQILQDAGVPVESDYVGARYYMNGELPAPTKYLIPKWKPAPAKVGQFDASLQTITY